MNNKVPRMDEKETSVNEIIRLKNQVETVLVEDEESRNSDTRLTIKLWEKYYPQYVDGGKVELRHLYNLPIFDTVSRARRLLQNNDGKLLPTNSDVVIKRRINQKYWALQMAKENRPIDNSIKLFEVPVEKSDKIWY